MGIFLCLPEVTRNVSKAWSRSLNGEHKLSAANSTGGLKPVSGSHSTLISWIQQDTRVCVVRVFSALAFVCVPFCQSWSAALIRHAALLGAAVGLVHVVLSLYARKDM